MVERSLGADRIAAQLQGIAMAEEAAGDPRSSEGQNTGESNQTAMTQTE